MSQLTRLTIDDIAREAGVSKGTVSRVINGHSTVALHTRERVSEVMNRFGYSPDPMARHLSWRTGQTLGLSLDEHDLMLHPYLILFRRALEARTAHMGVQLVDLRGDLTTLKHLPTAVLVMHARNGDSRLSFLEKTSIPAVLIGHQPEFFWVAPHDHQGAFLATDQLIKAGHRQLAYLGKGDSQVAQDREAGFLEAAAQVKAQTLSIPSDFTVLGGYRAIRKAWEAGQRFTGLFAQTDESAVGAIAALEDLGLNVPTQVSVIGFDGLPELPYNYNVRLSTVSQDIPRIAYTALDLMQEAIAGAAPRGEFIPIQLITGATIAPPFGGTP